MNAICVIFSGILRHNRTRCLYAACALLCAGFVSQAGAQKLRGRTLGLSSMEVDVIVGAAESEITATMEFTPRPAAKHRNSYDLFIPVFVPDSMAGDSTGLKKYKPALSVERRPVILKRAAPPATVATIGPTAITKIDAMPGMTIIWWRAVLRWPRRGEPLIVDMRYLQKHATDGRMRSCGYLPIVPDGSLTNDSRAVLRTDLPGTALYLRSGKPKKARVFANWTKWMKWTGQGKPMGKSLECGLQHNVPIIVDLVAE